MFLLHSGDASDIGRNVPREKGAWWPDRLSLELEDREARPQSQVGVRVPIL